MLPKDYQLPKSESRYMKFEQGDNAFRVLSSAIVGWEGWTQDNKPQRFPMDKKPKNLTQFKNQSLKHFWAFVVWNYRTERVEILEVTQVGIQESIKSYVDDAEWGDPKEYDIVVAREGEGLDTKYTVRAKPHKEVAAEVKKAYADDSINLEALFDGENPFGEKVDSDDEVDINDIPE